MWCLLTVALTCAVVVSRAAPAQVEITGATSALMYLSKFGYMDPSATNPENGALLSEDAVTRAVIDFQAFAGLNQTGLLDGTTVEMMNMPRCGNRDVVGHGTNTRRKKRYALQGSRWRVRELTYKISKYPTYLERASVDREVAAAFKVWEDVSSLRFSPATTGKVHIEVRFEKGEHGDGDPFDGKGGTLAHAYFPIYGGDAHFDDTEEWSIGSYKGTNLFQVAAHEFGHSLGLSHSDVRSSLMAPFYRGYERNFKLDDDDMIGIQKLYGKPSDVSGQTPERPAPSTTLRPPTSVASDNVLCQNARIDAIVTMVDKNTYVFKGTKYWLLTDDSTAPGYPRAITADWDGLPGDVDAAFTWVNGKTYFFKGSMYWRYSNMTRDKDYPKDISKGFAGIPDSVDGAFVWSGNGKIYFFKDDKYWRFDPTNRPPVKDNYPKEISNWEGIPNNIDDAMQYSNGFTYFFKDGRYWRFNDRAFRVDTADPPFPRPVGYWWFGCPASGAQVAHPTHHVDAALPTGGDVHEDSFDADGSSSAARPFEHGPHLRFASSQHQLQQGGHHDAQHGGAGALDHTPLHRLLIALVLPVLVGAWL